MDSDDVRYLEKLRRDKKKAEAKDQLKEVALIANCIGELLSKYEKWDEAISEHETELALSEALEDKIGAAVACRKIGECYCALEQFDKALQLQQQHLQLARSCDSMIEEQRALATIGRTHLFQWESARTKGTRTTALKNAEESFVRSLEVCEKLKPSVKQEEYMEMRARLFLNLGLVYDGRREVRQCAEYMKKAIAIAQQHRLYDDLYRCQFSLSGIYQRNNNYSQALRFMEEACSSAQKMKQKHLEAEALFQKAMILVHLEDFGTARHLLKKCKKLGFPTEAEGERVHICYRAAVKMEDASSELKESEGNIEHCIKLCETIADSAADAGNFKQAISYYIKMLTYSKSISSREKDLIPVYVSLAQTYKDDKQYLQAIEYFHKEMDCRGDDAEQVCRTWLNIAEAQELAGEGYSVVSQSYLKAYENSRKAKHRKLQIQCLKSLIELQKLSKQETHRRQTEEKLKQLRNKFHVREEEELSDEGDSQEDKHREEDDICMSDLTESEEDEEETDSSSRPRMTQSGTSRTRRTVQTKRNEKGETPLHRACIEGNLKKVKKLIEGGHTVNPRDYCGWIPLHEAANHDFYEITEYLLEHGAAVNDRGGQHCGGVTPLIDAANCGNVEIMELLIDKGANTLAKDVEGNSALDCLRSWRDRCSDSLSPELLNKIRKMEGILLGNKGPVVSSIQNKVTSSQRHQHNTENVDNSNVGSPGLPQMSRRRSMNKFNRRSRNSVIVHSDSDTCDSEMDIDKNTRTENSDSSDSDIPEYNNPLLEDLHVPSSSATDTYRNAISSMRSASHRVSQSQSKSDRKQRSEVTGHALLLEDEIVDDWLVDDLQPIKRRKMDVNGIFSTRSSRDKDSKSGKSPSHRTEPRRKTSRSKTNSVDGVAESNIENYESDDAAGQVEVLGEDFDINFQEGFSQPSAETSQSQVQNSKSSRLKQTTLSQFSSTGSESAASIHDTLSPNTSLSSTRISNITREQNFSSSVSNTVNVPSHVAGLMRVKVRVKEKLLLVPVMDNDGTKTISWLAQEVSQRYYSMCGVRPTLTLSTRDGAFLAPDDPISLVLTGTEEIEASVESWDLPSPAECYVQACKTLHSVPYRNVRTILQSCEGSGKVSLDNLALRSAQFVPIARAIQCQSCIRELHLKGNRLGDNGIESLKKTLETLPNLAVLDISCDEVTSIGLKQMCLMFTAGDGSPGKPKPLQNLTSLDMSHNSLGDTCIAELITLLYNLPRLTRLGLRSCDLTIRFFEQHRMRMEEVLHGSCIEEVDVSLNRLGPVGVELLLKCLPARKIRVLKLCATVSAPCHGQLSRHIHHFLTQEGCALKELWLSDCHLGPEDTDFIIRFPVIGKNLQTLSLSANPKLDNKVLQQIIQSSASPEVTCFEILCMEGCGVQSPLDTDVLDVIGDKLSSSCPLHRLYVTCGGMDKVDCDSVEQVWRGRWGDQAMVNFLEDTLRLGVLEK